MKNDDYGKMSNDDQMNGLDVIEVVNQSSNPLINQEMGPPQTIKLQVIIFFKYTVPKQSGFQMLSEIRTLLSRFQM